MSSYDNGGQYTRHSILRYEKIFGHGYVSTGGEELAKYFSSKLSLTPSGKILDIGSGLGGPAFHLADTFQAKVLGIDLAENMVDIANERAAVREDVSFQLDDIRTMHFEDATFDLVWSRDTLLHIPEKLELFRLLYKWLKPGGKVMITDYSRKAGELSADYSAYVKKSGYHLLDPESYGQVFRDAGFEEVFVDDWTDRFIETLRLEQADIREREESFLEFFTKEDLVYLVSRWEDKIQYCLKGDMKVGLWIAQKIS